MTNLFFDPESMSWCGSRRWSVEVAHCVSASRTRKAHCDPKQILPENRRIANIP